MWAVKNSRPRVSVAFLQGLPWIAGTLLGEMALCAKKRPPGKRGKRWGIDENGCYDLESQGKRDD